MKYRSLIFMFAYASTAMAQAKTGVITGVVKDSSGHAIPNVEVTALKAEKVVRTDTAGKFVLAALSPGNSDISFRRLAYEPVVLLIDVPSEDTTDVEVTLGVAAQRLTGVVVQDKAEQIRTLEAFEARRKQGIGHFITRADIEKRRPFMLSDMVRMVPGAKLLPMDNGRVALRFARVGRDNCPPQYYVDGIQVTGFNIDDMPPGDVEGVELYGGAAGIPPEFNRLHSTTICGAVIIWTRIPGNTKVDGSSAKP
jgi:hypothetical protein